MNKSTVIVALIAVCLLALVPKSGAQSYGTALGLRFGNQTDYRSLGLTAQQRIKRGLTLEGIVQSEFNNNTTVHGLIKKHDRLISKRFNNRKSTRLNSSHVRISYAVFCLKKKIT